jgi:predicted nucleic acid-binding protein
VTAVSAVLVDTSVFVALERRSLHALERVLALLDGEGLAVSVVTVAELLGSPSLPPPWRSLFESMFADAAEVLPVSTAAAYAGVDAARRVGGAMPPTS